MKRLVLAAVALALAVVVTRGAFYAVDAAEYAYVTFLGEHVATHDGSTGEGGGLHGGWPWPLVSVQRLDRRLQQFDLPATEQLTHDPEGRTVDKRLLVEAYVCWRIADREAVDRFVRRIGSAERARGILAPRVNGQLGAALGQMRMDDLVSVAADPATGRTRVEETLEALREGLLNALREPVRAEYGIELVDVRLRRFSHPPSVREAIFKRIQSERGKKATEYQSEGRRLARNIETEAEQKVRELLAQARAEEATIQGRADAEAMRLRNEAHRQDPEFYAFLKKLEKMQSIVGDGRTTLLLSTHRPMFDLLFAPPASEKKAGKP